MAKNKRRLTATLSWLLPSSLSKVNISQTSDRQINLLVNVMATNDALQSTCLTLSQVERAILQKQQKQRLLFYNHLLSDYFLLSTYFLAVSCYKCMGLTTSRHGHLRDAGLLLVERFWFHLFPLLNGWMSSLFMPLYTFSATIEKLWVVFTTHDLPERIVTDNGAVFTSDEFQDFLKMNGVTHTRTSPYHPPRMG